MSVSGRYYDVVIVGAGAAGVGMGVALSNLELETLIVDREAIGHSFRQWPEETRLLTPSFPANSFGLADLNAVTPDSSPAFALSREHPTGGEYADYLERAAEFHELSITTGVDVTEVTSGVESAAQPEHVAFDGGGADEATDGFTLTTTQGPICSQFVIWAAGHFGAPASTPFEGASHAIHYAEIDSFAEFASREKAATGSDSFLVIGGYESGMDAACGLTAAGFEATVVDSGAPWAFRHPDPSESLSPFTHERIASARQTDRLHCLGGIRIESIEPTTAEAGADPAGFDVYGIDSDGDRVHHWTPNRPILATGFDSVLGPIEPCFERVDDGGHIDLTDRDESTTTPGLFLSGPDVVHNGVKFCFIYKFRARFPVIAETIGERLGVDTEPLNPYREANMFLDDLSCCEPDMCDC